MALGGAAFQDADGSDGLQPLRNPRRVLCKRSKQARSYDTIWNRRLMALPELKTWIRLGSCSSSDLGISSRSARCGLRAPWGDALLKHLEPWRLRSQTPALGGCALKTLMWLGYLTATQRVKHCNRVAKPLRGLRARPGSGFASGLQCFIL